MRRFRRQLPVLLFLLSAVLQAQSPLTAPFRVDVPDGQATFLPDVAASSRGDFVVTWLEGDASQDRKALRARRFSAEGAPLTEAILVTDQALTRHAAVAVREDGSFLVGFTTGLNLAIGVYRPDGTLVGTSAISVSGEDPAIAVRRDGSFLLTWKRGGAIFARVFRVDLLPLGAERVLAFADLTAPLQALARPDGGFVVAWGRVRPIPTNPHFNGFTIFAQRLGPAGAPRGKPITVRKESSNGADSPDLAQDAAGNFLVAWTEYLGGGVWGILGRRYSAAGAPLSSLLTLERTVVSGPRLTSDPAGNFVVAWLVDEILAQRFTAGGAPFRPVFQVDTPPPAATWAPDVAGAASGNFVVVWAAQDGIYARLYQKR